MGKPAAKELIATATDEIVVVPNRFLDLLEDGRVPRERLQRFAGEQYWILRSDQRSFAALAARFPDPPAGEMFLSLSGGEIQAQRLLLPFAHAVGVDEAYLRGYEPDPMAQTYPAFLAWSAINGTLSGITLAMLTNFGVWGAYCARTADALASRYGLADDAVGFFRYFSKMPPGFEDQAASVIQAGLDAGEDPAMALRMARALYRYEIAFWEAMAEGL
ncbi:MAG: transcriptional regulator [Actinomycetes bacterium]